MSRTTAGRERTYDYANQSNATRFRSTETPSTGRTEAGQPSASGPRTVVGAAVAASIPPAVVVGLSFPVVAIVVATVAVGAGVVYPRSDGANDSSGTERRPPDPGTPEGDAVPSAD